MDNSEPTLTRTEFEALKAFREIAARLPGEWIPAHRLGRRVFSQALQRLAKKGVVRKLPHSAFFRLPESEEETNAMENRKLLEMIAYAKGLASKYGLDPSDVGHCNRQVIITSAGVKTVMQRLGKLDPEEIRRNLEEIAREMGTLSEVEAGQK